jgi:hypothetical protein
MPPQRGHFGCCERKRGAKFWNVGSVAIVGVSSRRTPGSGTLWADARMPRRLHETVAAGWTVRLPHQRHECDGTPIGRRSVGRRRLNRRAIGAARQNAILDLRPAERSLSDAEVAKIWLSAPDNDYGRI